jgi:hypothetical protein
VRLLLRRSPQTQLLVQLRGHPGLRLLQALDALARLPAGLRLSFNLSGNDICNPETIDALLRRIEASGAQLYDTAEQGALQIRLGRFESPRGLRAERRFWREK